MAYPNWVFSMFSFLGFALVIIPLPWHLHAWNAGTVMFMLWTAVGCLNVFVNSIVWNGNVNNPAPVWCDISIRIYFGLSVAIASTSLCINRRLYEISIAETVSTTKADKRRAMYIDLAITIIIPVLEMVLAYIPQGHRFDIYEDVGCYPEVYDTWVAILIVFVPPLAISCVSATYCARSIWFFNKRRRHFQELLSGSAGSRLTTGRYLRLMGLASMEFVVSIPLASYCIYTNVAVNGIHPWISWANTHSNFSNVNLFPSLFWENSKGAANIEFSRWMPVVCSIVFFAFFGFAQEALRHYRRAYDVVASRVGLPTRSSGADGSGKTLGSASGSGSMPNMRSRPRKKRDSFGSVLSDSFHCESMMDSVQEKSEKDTVVVPDLSADVVLSDVGGFLNEKTGGDLEAGEASSQSSGGSPVVAFSVPPGIHHSRSPSPVVLEVMPVHGVDAPVNVTPHTPAFSTVDAAHIV